MYFIFNSTACLVPIRSGLHRLDNERFSCSHQRKKDSHSGPRFVHKLRQTQESPDLQWNKNGEASNVLI